MADAIDFLKVVCKCILCGFAIFGMVCFFASMGDNNRRLLKLEELVTDLKLRMDWLDAKLDYCERE